jgi:quercetin dioxygenase-like cupin family protein
MECSRRDLGLVIAALLAPRGLFSAEEGVLPAKAYRLEDLPVKKEDGNISRAILAGKMDNGLRLQISEHDIAPGERPHPPHRHATDQALLVIDGTFEVTIAGEKTRLGPGSMAYLAANVDHGILNAGTTQARYFSVTLGGNSS